MFSKRCAFVVYDEEVNVKRQCTRKTMKSSHIDYCYEHYHNVILKNIYYIQRVIRAYLCRKKIKHLKDMPPDLQEKIVRLTRNEYYNKKRNKMIVDILINKIHNFIIKHLEVRQNILYVRGAIKSYNEDTEVMYHKFKKIGYELFHIYYLLEKYNVLIKDDKRFYNCNYMNGLERDQSMFSVLQSTATYIILCAVSEINLKGLSRISNFNENFSSIKKFNSLYCFKLI